MFFWRESEEVLTFDVLVSVFGDADALPGMGGCGISKTAVLRCFGGGTGGGCEVFGKVILP